MIELGIILAVVLGIFGVSTYLQDMSAYIFNKTVDGSKPYDDQKLVPRLCLHFNKYANIIVQVSKISLYGVAGLIFFRLAFYLL